MGNNENDLSDTTELLKTSEQRNDIDWIIILDADWRDRKNFEYSFYKELITQKEYNQRLWRSTQVSKKDLQKHNDLHNSQK